MTSQDMTPVDISTELFRSYHYPDGSTYKIDQPRHLYVFEGKNGWTQRVVDHQGVTHRPTPGWIAISWKPFEGTPAFVA